MSNEHSRHLDPFTMALNHGETFGIFDRRGDIVDVMETPQGIFFEGSRHLSSLELEVNGKRPTLLSSTIREDNDCMTVDLANKEFLASDITAPESSVHIKRTKIVANENYSENIHLKNYNSFAVDLRLSFQFGADFKDVFELRGFRCAECPPAPRSERRGEGLVFRYLGRDGIERSSSVKFAGACASVKENKALIATRLGPGQSMAFDLNVAFSRSVPSDKRYLYEGELSRRPLDLERLKKRLPTVESSNPHFDHWAARSALDLLALMSSYGDNVYPMAGVPWYNTPFGRDGLLVSFQTLFASPFICKNTLLFLANSRARSRDDSADAEPGKILHELRKGELANIGALPFKKYYGAADSTFLFIWLAQIYFFRTDDKETLDALWPALEAALEWCENWADLDSDGFFEYKKRNPNGLDNQCWKDSWDSISHADGSLAQAPIAACEVQGYAYRAFSAAAKLYAYLERLDESRRWEEKAKELKRSFNEKFWLKDKNFIALALDKNKKACSVFSSNPGHCLATGIVDSAKTSLVGERLFEKDLFTGWGIRTLGAQEKRFNPMSYHNGAIWPHDNSLIAYGLKKSGQTARFMRLAGALYDSALQMDLQRLPELFCGFDRVENESPTLYPVSCSPQAWASGVVFLLMQSMLGLEINAVKKKIVFEDPNLPPYLDWLTIKELDLGRGKRFSFTANRTSDGEATIEIHARPAGWKVSIHK